MQRCHYCGKYRSTLLKMLSRHNHHSDKADPSSHTNVRYLGSPEKNERLRRLRLENKMQGQKIRRLRLCLGKVIKDRVISVDANLDNDLRSIVADASTTVSDSYPCGSFARLFWENQKRSMQVKNSCSMRWDPIMIKWCLYLRHVSGRGYEMLRDSGVINLPSQRTLRDYTYYTQTKSGFSDDVDRQLAEVAKIDQCPEREKYVVLLMDEMHIKEDIVYDKHRGRFINCFAGLINDH